MRNAGNVEAEQGMVNRISNTEQGISDNEVGIVLEVDGLSCIGGFFDKEGSVIFELSSGGASCL